MKLARLNLIVLLLIACSRPIPAGVAEQLNRYFSGLNLEPGWRFVKLTHGFGGKTLVADILVDRPLPGSREVQQAFLRDRLCPPLGGNERFWRELQGFELAVAVYTQDRKYTALSECPRPL
ncbi:hypothetical protein [Candidatus Methylocalor cossyra]|uniref:Lipoprotein n=1 Tax=Candidatus Methylocalor cossyra TaxID=3108543 RepID=A0ABP1C4F2_9GAMM